MCLLIVGYGVTVQYNKWREKRDTIEDHSAGLKLRVVGGSGSDPGSDSIFPSEPFEF